MNARIAHDFATTPHTPRTPAQTATHCAELRQAAIKSQRNSAAVEQFFERQRQAHAARLARGSTLAQQVYPKLPSAEAATEALTAARVTLAAAIESRTAAEQATKEAADAEQRGREAIGTAQAALSSLGDVDDLISSFVAGQVRAGKPAELPESLQRQRAEAERLNVELNDAQAALRLLARQGETAQQRFAAAKQAVDSAVVGVLRAAGECIALRMVASQERAFTARRNLTTLAKLLRVGSARLEHTAATAQALHDVAPDMRPDLPAERDKLTAAWRAITEQLNRDASAPLPLGD